MKKTQKIFTTSAVLFLLFFPALGFLRAQTDTSDNEYGNDYVLLAPLPGTTEGNCTDSSDFSCQTNLSTYIKGAFNLIVGMAAVLAFVVLTYGGVLYMTSDAITGKSQGKDYITNALVGLLLVIASYVILYTINPQIVGFNFNMASPNTTAQSAADLAAINAASQSTSGLTASGADLLSGSALAADQSERNTLKNDGITVNNPPCSASLTSNCTDVNLLKPTFVTALSNVASSCATSNSGSCNMILTGGNEATLHNTDTTHSTGDTADFAPTSSLNNYLGNASPVNGSQVTKNGITFTYETVNANPANTGAHWHATICTGTTVASCP